ncbi:hypothetical protein [Bradyrhizobium sp. RT10b]|uniref:hypothetical protein n=1 Tax=Bradyrhizobium sp. RT10b TaxID=3156331 RepID=UPI003394ACF3
MAANRALEAGDLTTGRDRLGSAEDCATLAGSVMGFWHPFFGGQIDRFEGQSERSKAASVGASFISDVAGASSSVPGHGRSLSDRL